jgi:hypothetical protein
MLTNNPIKNKTDTIGFLLIITNIPQNIESTDMIFITLYVKPLVKVSLNKSKEFKFLLIINYIDNF